MHYPYQTIVATSRDFYSAAAFFTPGRVSRGRQLAGFVYRAEGRAISLNPLSEIRDLIVYLDDDQQGQVLLPGMVIVGGFTSFSIAPIMPATFVPDLPNLPGGSTTPLFFAPQRVLLDVWRDNVPPSVTSAQWVSVQQTKAVINAGANNNYALMVLRAPGLRSIRLWASNENTNNPSPSTVSLFALRPQLADALVDEPRATSAGTFAGSQTALASVSLGSAADGGSTAATTVISPGAMEYVMTITSGAGAGMYTVTVGAELTYYDGSA